MRVLVIGGAGFIGAPLVTALAARGCEVVIATRGASRRAGHVRADRGQPKTIAALVATRVFDTVIDMVAYEPESTQRLLDVLRGRVARYVLVSSADVYRNYGGLHRREACEPIDRPLNEDAPLRTSRHPYKGEAPNAPADPQAWQDRYDKIPVEDAVRAQGALEWTILRLPMVFGPGDRNRRFAWAIRPMASAAPVLTAPAAWLAWRTSYGFVEDVAAAIVLAALHPNARNRLYNVGAATSDSNAAWAAHIARLLSWKGAIEPSEDSPIAARIADLDLRFPLLLDTSAIRAELGFSELADTDSALRSAIADEMAH